MIKSPGGPCLANEGSMNDHSDRNTYLTLFRPGIENQTIEELEQKFTAEGFRKYDTILGAEGIGVFWPAVFRNSTDGKAGEEIDQEMFEKLTALKVSTGWWAWVCRRIGKGGSFGREMFLLKNED
ncbi:hypothetical protein PISL3812_02402 [Talaromyces islandicus]|uniref:Uncharacterized protein n=1 Tax=Talaromyces islandicus TaxID=28573 RepID=A0A0U1LQ56_TALIS|nr:hypothetical protein PISL3812_02402 [Talaromyces islandicus]